MAQLTYDPGVFEAPDLEKARFIILTPQAGQSTDERWQRETPYLVDLLGRELALQPGQLVIDYGCGIGRIAKGLIERYQVRVLGVDASEKMRGYAPAYVASAAFSIVSRSMFAALSRAGMRADAAIGVWVLQHCARPAEDIDLLCAALKPDGRFGVVNSRHRFIPVQGHKWVSDGVDIRQVIGARFHESGSGSLDPSVVGEYAEQSFWATYRPATP